MSAPFQLHFMTCHGLRELRKLYGKAWEFCWSGTEKMEFMLFVVLKRSASCMLWLHSGTSACGRRNLAPRDGIEVLLSTESYVMLT